MNFESFQTFWWIWLLNGYQSIQYIIVCMPKIWPNPSPQNWLKIRQRMNKTHLCWCHCSKQKPFSGVHPGPIRTLYIIWCGTYNMVWTNILIIWISTDFRRLIGWKNNQFKIIITVQLTLVSLKFEIVTIGCNIKELKTWGHMIWGHIWVISNRVQLARCYWPRVKFYNDFNIIWNINFPMAICILRITCRITRRWNKSSIINFRDAQNRLTFKLSPVRTQKLNRTRFEYPWPIPNSSPQANTLVTPLKML